MSKISQARARLQRTYREGLHSKLETVRGFWELAKAGDSEACTAIRRLSHQLKGSGSSYGFSDITEAAGEVEHCSEEMFAERVQRLLAVLEQHAQADEKEGPGALIVEDDPDQAKLIAHAVELAGRRATCVGTAEAAQAAVMEVSYEIILLDLLLPGADGRSLLTHLKSTTQGADVPIVVLSGVKDIVAKRECMALGAEQYIEKPLDLELLTTIVANVLDRQQTRHQRSRVDSLTGLMNRDSFDSAFERLVAVSDRIERPMSLAILDIDHFKSVNDVYGHAAGDRVLRQFATCLTTCLRSADMIARWGGEEFAVLFADTDAYGAEIALKKVQDAFRGEVLPTAQGEITGVTFSAGLVPIPLSASLDELMARADALLYEAKSRGRDLVATEAQPLEARRLAVLVVEDDDDMARYVEHLLEGRGYAPKQVSTGEAAIEALREERFSLVLLDAILPEMSGLDVLKYLRRSSRNRATPVVMLTAVGAESAIEEAFDMGIDDYVTKPFKDRELTARVRRLIRK